MEQFTDTLQPDEIISVDYESRNQPDAVRKFRPKVFREGNGYCCSYGPNPQDGIFGCGDSPEDAINNWNKAYLKDGIKFFASWNDGKV